MQDLEYFVAKDGIIYLVKGYYHPEGKVLAYPVYWPDANGDRFHPRLGTYRKDVQEVDNSGVFALHPEYQHHTVPRTIPLINKSDIVEVFQPRTKTAAFLRNEAGTLWTDLARYLITDIGVAASQIGVFGSYLVALHRNRDGVQIKDIDLVIYGIKNLYLVKAKIEQLRRHFGYRTISPEHILYHAEKFGRPFDPTLNSFHKTLANKWSSIQIDSGLLATLRFAYLTHEIPLNPLNTPIAKTVQVIGVVTEDMGTNFMPRVFSILADDGQIYTTITYFWGFQACVRRGDRVMVTGNLHSDQTSLSVDLPIHGIKILAAAVKS